MLKSFIILLFSFSFLIAGKFIDQGDKYYYTQNYLEAIKYYKEAKVKKGFLDVTSKLGWKLIANSDSKLAGKSGNVEELYYFTV